MSDDQQPSEEPEHEQERELTWAEVYRVNACDGCGRADCEHCTARFLEFLRNHGTPRPTTGP